MADDALWKRRFHVYALVRLTGLALFLLGAAIAFSDLVREGGWPVLGGMVAALGAIDAVVAPRLLKRRWEREDAK
jgi:hypothetical protein